MQAIYDLSAPLAIVKVPDPDAKVRADLDLALLGASLHLKEAAKLYRRIERTTRWHDVRQYAARQRLAISCALATLRTGRRR